MSKDDCVRALFNPFGTQFPLVGKVKMMKAFEGEGKSEETMQNEEVRDKSKCFLSVCGREKVLRSAERTKHF